MNTVRYARWMEERGWKVIVFCVNGSKLQHTAVSHNLKTISIQRNRKYFDFRNAWKVSRLFKKHNIGVCWFRDTRDFALLGWVKRFSGGSLKLMYQQAMQFGVSKKDPAHTFRFRAVDAWISTLHFLANQVKTQTRFPHNRIHVIPLGVDEEKLLSYGVTREMGRSHFKLSSDAFVMGIIGRLDKLKGQLVAIEATRILLEKGYPVQLLIVGESTLNENNFYEQEMRLRVSELELQDNIHFAAYTKKVELFYEAIDLFLLCSKGETFGTVTIEAMAFQKPIIGTNSSGTPEILADNCGLLFEPENEEELAERMIFLYENKKVRDELAANGNKKFHLKFSKKASMDQLERIVQDLIQ